MKLLQVIILAILTVACSVAALFLYLLWNAKRVVAVPPNEEGTYTIAALALNITILEIVMALVGFIVAVMGFFGYAGINRLLKKSGWKDVIPVAGAGRRVARRCERRVQ
ncbi:hypothetical protein P1J78_22405, partial [Psychromarinibacter sp. C21-152]